MGSKKQEIISLIEEMDEEGLDKLLYFIKLQLKKKIIFNGDKGSILDLKVKTERGERINIEVQLNNVDDFRKRSLYYCSKMYAETIQEGETYTNLRKSIVINLIDFDLIDETERCHTIYKIIETEEKFELTDDLEIHYIELKKLKSN